MRMRRAQEEGVSLSRPVDIVDIAALAGNETVIFLTPYRCADSCRAHPDLPKPVCCLFRSFALWHACHVAGAGGDRLDDIVVAGAAAKIAFELFADRLLVEIVALAAHEIDRGHDHARRAEAALQTMMLAESFLHRMQLIAVSKPLDRQDV